MKNLPALLKKIARRRFLVIGDVMLDRYLWGDANRISPEAPVPVVHLSGETDTVGGAANVAANIAALGAAVEVVGGIGRDANGDILRRHLASKGIEFDDRFLMDGAPTITKTRVVVRNQQLCRLDYEEVPSKYRLVLGESRRSLLEAKIAKTDGVILSDYAKGIVTTAATAWIAGRAHALGKFVALDPKPASGASFKDLDLITPNRKEAIELSGEPPGTDDKIDFRKVSARIWAKYRPKNLVITLGSEGMLIGSDPKRPMRAIETAARQVYDVSGAGDTVIAALSLALTTGVSLDEATHFANAAAGVVVGKLGTATVTPAELLAYVNG